MDRAYLCIDLKCFYASVECVDRGHDPFEHRLVVADPSRGRKTICLAISPAMKALGVRNRCRVFEIPDGIDYEMARPRMRRYMEVSADIYARYLRYFSPKDIHVYSVDEVFIDVTPYLALYGKTPRELAVELIDMVRRETGICATAGIGTNLFLAKVALDVTAKHAPDNIGELDEERYKCLIWPHRPITDIWGIGPGIARRLAEMGAHDMEKLRGGLTLRYARPGEKFYPLGAGDSVVECAERHVVYADGEKVCCWLWNYRDTRDASVDDGTKEALFLVDCAFETEWRSVEEGLSALASELSAIGCTVRKSGVVSAAAPEAETE